jgi:hypothetical protein
VAKRPHFAALDVFASERLRLERGLTDILRFDNGPEFLSDEFVA